MRARAHACANLFPRSRIFMRRRCRAQKVMTSAQLDINECLVTLGTNTEPNDDILASNSQTDSPQGQSVNTSQTMCTIPAHNNSSPCLAYPPVMTTNVSPTMPCIVGITTKVSESVSVGPVSLTHDMSNTHGLDLPVSTNNAPLPPVLSSSSCATSFETFHSDNQISTTATACLGTPRVANHQRSPTPIPQSKNQGQPSCVGNSNLPDNDDSIKCHHCHKPCTKESPCNIPSQIKELHKSISDIRVALKRLECSPSPVCHCHVYVVTRENPFPSTHVKASLESRLRCPVMEAYLIRASNNSAYKVKISKEHLQCLRKVKATVLGYGGAALGTSHIDLILRGHKLRVHLILL